MKTKLVRVSLYTEANILERGRINVFVPEGATHEEIVQAAWDKYDEGDIDCEWKEIETYSSERMKELTTADDVIDLGIDHTQEAAA